MPINSNRKGKGFELQVANILTDVIGLEVRRSQQYCGGAGDADIVGIPGLHLECKAVEALNLTEAMTQAASDAREGTLPVVIHKKKWGDIMVTFKLADLVEFCETVIDAHIKGHEDEIA